MTAVAYCPPGPNYNLCVEREEQREQAQERAREQAEQREQAQERAREQARGARASSRTRP